MSNILLLEDDLSLVNGLSFAFKKHGYELNIARTLKEADGLWMDGKYDLLVLDVSLPDGSGFEFCKKVRLTSKVPIIFLTAHADVDMAISAFRSGAADILKKPVSSEILLEAVERAVESDFAFRQKDFRIVRYQEFYDALTQREKQILNSVNAGLMNYQIAQRLGLSERTVETHRANAYKKVGVKDLQQLKEFLSHVDI